ncbi:hypothetical protein ACFL0M_03795 [Thermodesulfobacteriota bacterium]
MGITHSPGAAYGWRARIGLLQPGVVSDTNPYEFYLMAPQGVQLILTSLGVGGMSQKNYDRAIANFETPVKRLVARKPDAIIQAGIPPLVTHGWGIEDELRARVAKITSTPYISDAAGCIKAMQALNMKQIVVVSAFSDELVELIRSYLKHAEIEVLGHFCVRKTNSSEESGSLPLEVVYRAARSIYLQHAKHVDGIWITQASVPSVGIINDLETDLGVPVVTSAQALMWAGLRLAGVHTPVTSFGRLFDVQEPDY